MSTQPAQPAHPAAPAETQRRRRGHHFYPPRRPPLPALRSTTTGDPHDALVHVRYFLPGSIATWLVVEYDPATTEAWGWAEVLPGCGEFGYFLLHELETLRHGWCVVERDCYGPLHQPVRSYLTP